MKMKNVEAFQYAGIMTSLNESGKLGFAIAKNRRKLESELKEYNEARDNLIETYGTPNGDGTYSFTAEGMAKFMEGIAEYDGIEFEFQPQTVDEDTFCSGSLTSQQMYMLDWMVA